MSKDGGGSSGPSAEEEKASAKAYWDNYTQWQGDATKSKDTKLGDIRARYAGQGALGKILMDAETSKYNKEMAGLQKGEHGTALMEYYKKMQTNARKPAYTPAEQESDSNNPQAEMIWVDDPFNEAGGQFVNPSAPSAGEANRRREFENSPIDTSYDGMMGYYQKLFGGGSGGADPEKELESDRRARISGSGGMWQ